VSLPSPFNHTQVWQVAENAEGAEEILSLSRAHSILKPFAGVHPVQESERSVSREEVEQARTFLSRAAFDNVDCRTRLSDLSAIIILNWLASEK
jgi:hypothetical protein